MALQEDIGAVLKSALEPQSAVPTPEMELSADAVAPPPEPAQPSTIEPSVIDTPPTDDNVIEPVKVAGMKDIVEAIAGRIGKRVGEAEKRTQPALPDVPVQIQGKTILAREATDEELNRLNTVFSKAYTKGINFPNIADAAGDVDLATYIQQLKNGNPELFEKARRGTLNFKQMLEKADAKNVDSTIYEWLTRSVGSAANGEDILAGMLAAVSLTKNTQGAFLKARGMIDGPEKDALLKRAAQMASMEGQLYANLSAAGSEAGRSLYVLQQAQQQLGAGAIATRAAQIQSLFGAETTKDIEHLGIAYLALKSPHQRAAFVKQGFVARSMDVMAEAFINSILSNPVTHIVNVAGNAGFMATRMVETAIAGGIGKVRSKITGNADRVYAREAIGEAQGVYEGFVDALLVAGKALAKEEAGDLATKLDVRRPKAIGNTGDIAEIYNQFRNGNVVAGAVNTLGVTVRMPGRFLLAEDEFFKAIGYRMGLRKEAYAHAGRVYDEAIAAGKTPQDAMAMAAIERNRILTDPPASTVKEIQDAAREMVFQKDLTGAMKGFQEATQHPLAKLFVPFVKTPSNIIKAVVERTPVVNLLSSDIRDALRAGGRQADIALSKLAMGSMIMGTFAYMAKTGGQDGNVVINGNGPSDPNVRKAWLRRGFLPYSVSVKQEDGTYKSITYNRFDPASGLLGIAADYAYYSNHESSGKVLSDLAIAATTSITTYALEHPFMQGVSDLTRVMMIQNPKDRVTALQKLFAEKVTTGALSILPTVSSGAAAVTRYMDPNQKNTMLPAKGLIGEDPTTLSDFMKGFYTALQKAKSRNPFFNKDLPPALNLWGEKIPQGSGSAWEFINPVRIRNSKFNDVDEELQRINFGIADFPKKISGVELNANQYNKWIETANAYDGINDKMPGDPGYSVKGTMLYVLTDLVLSKDYMMLPNNEAKRDAITGIVGKYRKVAKERLFMDDTVDGYGLKAKIDLKGK